MPSKLKEAYAFNIYSYIQAIFLFQMQFKRYFKGSYIYDFFFLFLAFTMNLIQIVRDHWVHVLVPMGFVVGCYLDRKNDEKLTAFRNKSLLFKRLVRAFFKPAISQLWKYS